MKPSDIYRLLVAYIDLVQPLQIRPHSGAKKLMAMHTGVGVRSAQEEAELEKLIASSNIDMAQFVENCIKRNIVGYSTLATRYIAVGLRQNSSDGKQCSISSASVNALAKLVRVVEESKTVFSQKKIEDNIDSALGSLSSDYQLLVIGGLADSAMHVDGTSCDAVVGMFVKCLDELFSALADTPFQKGHLKVLRILRYLLGTLRRGDTGIREVDETVYTSASRRLSVMKISATTLAAAPMPTADIVKWLKEDDASTVSRTSAEYIRAVSRFVVR